MAQQSYSISSMTFIDRETGLPVGETIQSFTSATFNRNVAIVEQKGGVGNETQCAKAGEVTHELTVAFGDRPSSEIIELLTGAKVTKRAAETSGAVTTLVNKKGTTIANATTGIASVGIISGKETDLKYTTYVVKAVSATTVNIYAYSNNDFNRGTASTFITPSAKTIAEGVTIATGTALQLESPTITNGAFGVELTGGSGTIAMTIGDTATFEVRPPNSTSEEWVLGELGSKLKYFELECTGYLCNSDAVQRLRIYKVIGGSFNHSMTVDEFTNQELTLTVVRDNDKNATFTADSVVFS